MTLVHDVAEAIFAELRERATPELVALMRHWYRADRNVVAIAALKAMRSPDEEEGGRIETAGMFALPFDKVLDGEPYKQGNSALLCWQAMIDQAIKEGESHES